MDLIQAMIAATEDPPPTGIDVDRLISGERRRSRIVHVLAGVTVAVALVAGLMVLPVYLTSKPSGQSPGLAPPATATSQRAPGSARAPMPCVTPVATGAIVVGPSPRVPVTEGCGAAIARLTDALAVVLARAAPGVPFTDLPVLPGVWKDPHMVVGYYAGRNLPGGGLSVDVEASSMTPAQFRAIQQHECQNIPQAGFKCHWAEVDGAEVMVRSYPQPDTGLMGMDVTAVRADGTMASARTRGTDLKHKQAVPLTEQQLIAIATAPELTLYP